MTSKQLTLQQVQAVGTVALGNALGLLSDAETLLEAGQFERAYVLAVFGVEEFSKLVECRSIVMPGSIVTVAELNRTLRPLGSVHVARFARALGFLDEISVGALSRAFAPDDLATVAKEQLELRDRALYVEVSPSGVPLGPDDIDRDAAQLEVRLLIDLFGVMGAALWPDPWKASTDVARDD